ncbi:hypothetical protein KQX54_005552 [Cotesia glomerata]|uniref:Uncharacterized protein n=1 Tax=Cotesia glomerata TaxID=32391 RepID=A0AAV7HRX3_COTGL|nr:hypothetical protein KQX54_005552 [Cotesia glomerata]
MNPLECISNKLTAVTSYNGCGRSERIIFRSWGALHESYVIKCNHQTRSKRRRGRGNCWLMVGPRTRITRSLPVAPAGASVSDSASNPFPPRCSDECKGGDESAFFERLRLLVLVNNTWHCSFQPFRSLVNFGQCFNFTITPVERRPFPEGGNSSQLSLYVSH